MNPSEKDIYDMLSEYDLDGDGGIDYEEFLKMMSNRILVSVFSQVKARKSFSLSLPLLYSIFFAVSSFVTGKQFWYNFFTCVVARFIFFIFPDLLNLGIFSSPR